MRLGFFSLEEVAHAVFCIVTGEMPTVVRISNFCREAHVSIVGSSSCVALQGACVCSFRGAVCAKSVLSMSRNSLRAHFI